jgi:hypothetical protein
MAVQPVQSASVPRKLSGIKCRMPGGLVVFHCRTLVVLMLLMTKLLDISSSKQEKSSDYCKKNRRKIATACP